MARKAADAYKLDRVVFIPAAHPPHKAAATGADYEDRYRMVELACAVDLRFEASRIEAGEGKSYSIHTIEKLSNPNTQLFFIIGADAFAEITTWFRWQDVIRLTDFIVISRPGHLYTIPDGARVHRLDSVILPVSSSAIRRQLAQGLPPPDLAKPVIDYIVGHKLYHWQSR